MARFCDATCLTQWWCAAGVVNSTGELPQAQLHCVDYSYCYFCDPPAVAHAAVAALCSNGFFPETPATVLAYLCAQPTGLYAEGAAQKAVGPGLIGWTRGYAQSVDLNTGFVLWYEVGGQNCNGATTGFHFPPGGSPC